MTIPITVYYSHPLYTFSYVAQSTENLLRGSTDQDSRLSWNQMSDAARTSCVQFSKDVNSEDEEDMQSFVRHNTPHPKDLKARHPKMFPTPVDSTSAPTSDPSTASTHPTSQTATTGQPISARVGPTPATPTTPVPVTTTTSIAQRAQAAPVSPQPGPNPTHTPAPTQQTSNPSVNSYPSPAYANVVKSSSSHVERHVGFDSGRSLTIRAPEDEEEEEDDEEEEEEEVRDGSESKLRRRDTPHHLKNKRVGATTAPTATNSIHITASTSSSSPPTSLLQDSSGAQLTDEQRVKIILAKAAANAAGAGGDAGRTTSLAPAATTTTIAPASDSSDHDYENGDSIYRQHTIVINRTAGQGLGISIAGGRGSAAYIGDDEVCVFVVVGL